MYVGQEILSETSDPSSEQMLAMSMLLEDADKCKAVSDICALDMYNMFQLMCRIGQHGTVNETSSGFIDTYIDNMAHTLRNQFAQNLNVRKLYLYMFNIVVVEGLCTSYSANTYC
jgi:hypothetical protein